MRRELGSDLSTAMETVAQLEKQLASAVSKVKKERDARRAALSRIETVAAEAQRWRADTEELQQQIRAMRHDASEGRGALKENSRLAQENEQLRSHVANMQAEQGQLMQRMSMIEAEKRDIQQRLYADMMREKAEMRLKDELKGKNAQNFEAFKAQTRQEIKQLSEKYQKAEHARLNAEAASDKAKSEVSERKREMETLSWKCQRMEDIISSDFGNKKGTHEQGGGGGAAPKQSARGGDRTARTNGSAPTNQKPKPPARGRAAKPSGGGNSRLPRLKPGGANRGGGRGGAN